MDSGLKERLVGAAVLVALGVWLIPWILDGRDRPSAEAEATADAVELPAIDTPARTQTRTIALNETARPSAAADSHADPAHAPAAEPAPEPSRIDPAEAATPAETSTDEAATASPASADTAPPPAVPAKPEKAPADGWYVQLGSFSDSDNARRLAARVEPFGYDADVSTFRSGDKTLHRVRVGPSSTREGAEAVASSLAAHGFVAQVVTAD